MLFSETLLPLFCVSLRGFSLLSYKIFILASSANFLAASVPTFLHPLGIFFPVFIFRSHKAALFRHQPFRFERLVAEGLDM